MNNIVRNEAERTKGQAPEKLRCKSRSMTRGLSKLNESKSCALTNQNQAAADNHQEEN
jgi:hypothetical protein